MSLPRACFLFLLLTFPGTAQFLHAQTRMKRAVSKEFYSNGKIKDLVITRTTMSAYPDLFNFYKKTKVKRTEFDSLYSRKTRQTVRITKLGREGKPCYEIYSREVSFDEEGKRAYYEESICDKNKFTMKQYTNGKLVFTRIQKRRKRR